MKATLLSIRAHQLRRLGRIISRLVRDKRWSEALRAWAIAGELTHYGMIECAYAFSAQTTRIAERKLGDSLN